MKIRLRTAGILHKYLPPGSAGNSAELDLEDGATPIDVMRKLGMPAGASYLVTLNGEAVPRAEREKRTLSENDDLAIMPALRGG